MRELGIITDVNKLITISIWDELTKKVVTKQITNYDKTKEYKILSIVEYFSDTNTIIPIYDNNLTKKEQLFLIKTLKVVMDDTRYQQIFMSELDKLSKPKNK